MIQRYQWDASWGPKKLIFLIREIDDATMAGASVETCQSVALRSPWGRLWSHYTRASACTAYARARGIIDRFSHHCGSLNHELLGNGFQSPRRARALAYAVLVTTNHQTYLERPPGAELPPKKVCNLDPMAPRSRQKRQLPEGPQ